MNNSMCVYIYGIRLKLRKKMKLLGDKAYSLDAVSNVFHKVQETFE